MNTTRWHIPVLLGLATLLFFTNLGTHDLWPPDEPRFAEVAREMLGSGDYLAPHVNGQPYKEKPPLLFWAIAAASAAAGEVTAFTARLPSALAGLIVVLCTYALAARLYGARVAFWSGLVLATTSRFWWQARVGQIDMLLTACLAVALLCFLLWQDARRTRWLVAFYAAAAVAVYAKGPVGIVFPLLMIFAFYWRQKDERRETHWLIGTLAVAALIAVWLIPARMAVADVATESASASIASNLFRQTIGRFFLGVSKAQPPWYYVKTLVVDLMPWTLFLPWTLPWVWRRRREGPAMRLLLSWTLPALVFFSICVGKRAIYILPLFPVFAILIARSVLDLMDGERHAWRKRTALVWGVGLVGLGLAPLAIRLTEYREAWSPDLLIVSLAAFGFAGDTFHRAFKTEVRTLHATMACHFAGLALLCTLFIFPAANPYLSARAFCAPLRGLSEAGQDYRLYSVGFSREEYVFYAKHFHEPVLMKPNAPPDVDIEAVARIHGRLRKALEDPVAAVGIASFESVTEAELAALRAVVDAAVVEGGVDPDLAAAYRDGLRSEMAEFAAKFERPSPAFLFVREDAWRLLLPHYPHAPRYRVVRHAQVGRRTVLLMANTVGAARCDQRKPTVGMP